MQLCRLWAGQCYGTNTGKLFVEIENNTNAFDGTLTLNDSEHGIIEYKIQGNTHGSDIIFSGYPAPRADSLPLGKLQAEGFIDDKGNLTGKWKTEIGSTGTFLLYPHDLRHPSDTLQEPLPALHTARHEFGAIDVDIRGIREICDILQSAFSIGRVIVTVRAGAERAQLLENFDASSFKKRRAEAIRIYVQEQEMSGINRIANIEFGPNLNFLFVQSSDETWVLGFAEKLKSIVERYQSYYATNVNKFGISFNQFVMLIAIAFIPSLDGFLPRATFVIAVFSLVLGVHALHRRFLPLSVVRLDERDRGWAAQLGSTLLSWLMAATAALVATLLAKYLEGPFGI